MWCSVFLDFVTAESNYRQLSDKVIENWILNQKKYCKGYQTFKICFPHEIHMLTLFNIFFVSICGDLRVPNWIDWAKKSIVTCKKTLRLEHVMQYKKRFLLPNI